MRVPGLPYVVLLVLVIAAISCKGEATKVKADPSAPAGDVRAVTGEVTATRDGSTRALALGDVVAAGDRVHTGADGDVVIELRHNHVRWHLGPGQDRAPLEAAAWAAPPPAEGEVSGERTAVAGRHAEREAADTSASMAETRVMADDGTGGGSGSSAVASQGSGSAVKGKKHGKDQEEKDTKDDRRSTPDPKSEPINGDGDGACDEVACLLADPPMACCAKYKGSYKPEIGPDSIPEQDALDKDDITDALAKVKSKIEACGGKVADPPSSVQVSVQVSPEGSVTKAEVVDDDADPTLAKCVEAAVKRAKFTPTKQGGSFKFPAKVR